MLRPILPKGCISLDEASILEAVASAATVADVKTEVPEEEHKTVVKKSTKCSCSVCGKTFSSRQSLSAHRIKFHAVTMRKDVATYECKETGCAFRGRKCQLLIQHLQQEHCITCEVKTLEFETMDEFTAWKQEEERSSLSYFVHSCGSQLLPSEKISYFVCNRSGNYREKPVKGSQRQRTIKTQGSTKINGKCTASMKVSEDRSTKRVTVDYCCTHYGHTPSIAHIPIPKKTRLMVAAKLKAGFSVSRIVEDCRSASYQASGSLGRELLIGRKDVRNIKSQFKISEVAPSENKEHVSVSKSVENLHLIETGDIVVHKPRGVMSEEFPELELDDFLLAIQTKFQQQQYEALGKEVVCLDSSSKTTQSAFKLTSVLCADEWGEGIPVLWIVSSKEDLAMANCLFSVLRCRSPAITPEFLMSDDVPLYFEAFKNVFPEAETQKLLCIKRVQRAWQKAISEKIPKRCQEGVFQELKAIVHIQNVHDFQELLNIFLKKVLQTKEMRNFGTYFLTKFASRTKEWTAWARNYALVNTKTYAAAFDKVLKDGNYLEDGAGKQIEDLDTLVDVLFKLDTHYMEERIRKLEKGNANKKTNGIHARHRESLQLSESERTIEKGFGDVWTFLSTQCRVTKQSCSRIVCKLECSECKICIHSYTCSCPDMTYKKTICKHIHFIHQVAKSMESELETQVHYLVSDIDHDYCNQEETADQRRQALREILQSRRPAVDDESSEVKLRKIKDAVCSLVEVCTNTELLQDVQSSLKKDLEEQHQLILALNPPEKLEDN